MERWEKYNNLSGIEESLEEQALNMIVEMVLEDAENGVAESNRDIYYKKFKNVKKWLSEKEKGE